ncbi:MAG TPA: N-acyl homoserine lactonase family protein [Steroidobacteraceae bacterium]|nr:N-acyl homoserine lactonase family protein [Steroidobacteraceae bacterium]
MTHRIYAVRYGHLERSSDRNFLGGDDHASPMPLDYYVWVIKVDARSIVVDTGFDSGQAASRGRTLTRPVAEGLAAIDVDPREVTDVVITHMHYDHAGNAALFPRARFHVQDAEMAYCTGRAMAHRHLSVFFDAENVVDMVRGVFDGRVVFHAGDSVLCPGVTLHHLPGHTMGLQAVRVQTGRGPVVLASDAAHFWANLERETPYPVVADVPQYLESLRALRGLAPSIDHIIPGHDPGVLARFPAEAGVRDIVRLDLAPLARAAS